MKRFIVVISLSILLLATPLWAFKVQVGLIPRHATAPSTCKSGESYINTAENVLYFCEDDAWISAGTGGNPQLDNSAGLAGALSDETGASGGTPLAVFNYNPTLTGFALAADADLGDFDIHSIDGLYGVDDQVGLDLGTDGSMIIFSDTSTNYVTPINAFTAPSGVDLGFIYYADNAEDNADAWTDVYQDSISGGSYIKYSLASGSYVAALTLTNAGALTIPGQLQMGADSVDSAEINWAEPITVPFDNKLQFGDTGIYIFADDDGILDIVADISVDITNLKLASNLDATDYDLTSVDKIEGFDTGVFIDLGQDNQILFSADGAGTPFATPPLDFSGDAYFDSPIGLPLDTAIMFNATTENIQSDDAGYLDLNAATGIRLNGDVSGLTSLIMNPVAAPALNLYDSADSGAITAQILADSDGADAVQYFYVRANSSLKLALTLSGDGIIASGFIITPTEIPYTVSGDLDISEETSVILLEGDNDSTNEILDLQDAWGDTRSFKLIATSGIDADDTLTIAMTDTTCADCPAIVFDKVGENVSLLWSDTVGGWVVTSLETGH